MKHDGLPTQMSKQQQVLRQIMTNSPISKKELQEASGISWGMISNITNQLVEERYIEPYIRETQGVGRKAEEYDVNRSDNYCIGIDFNYNGIIAVITDMKGRIVEQYERIFDVREREYALQQVFEVTDLFFAHFKEKRILGIGFAVQGIVDIYEGISVLISAIKNWEDVPLKKIMEERYGVKVFLEHDPNCIMRCERVSGCLKGRNVTEAILVNHDPRIGAGMSVMTRGQICHGFHGKAGEIGTAPVNITEEGKFEYMEGHMTREGIVRDYKKLTGEDITYHEFVQLLLVNDSESITIHRQMGQYIGLALGTAANFLNPQVAIIHLTEEKKELLYKTISEVLERVFYDKTIEVHFSKLGQEAKAVGAALIASENAVNQL